MFTHLAASVTTAVTRLRRDEEGATAVEYGLIVGLIAVAVIAAVGLLTGALQEMFGGIADFLGANTPAAD